MYVPEQYAIENPSVLHDVQNAYVEAGSRALYTFTMGANAHKLGEFSLSDDVYRINKALAELSVSAADGRAFVGAEI